MKIAVLLFGHLRTFEQCWKGLQECLLSHYDCDVFLHTWDETDHNTKSWHNRTVMPANVDAEMLERLRICYKPKDMLVEHQEPIKEEDYTFLIAPYTTVSNAGMHFMFESMSKANQLRKAYEKHLNFSYDLVVVTRPDILLIHPLDLEATLYQAQICGYDLEHTRFFASLPGSTKKNPARLITNKGNDMLFFARPNVIDQYIVANQNLDGAFIREHILNVVSVYTAAEIRSGIEPVPISYQFAYDWRNVRPKPPQEEPAIVPKENCKAVPSWKKAVRNIIRLILCPLRKFSRWIRARHKWLFEE